MTRKILIYCPIFNEERHLGELLNSVLQQSMSDFHFIVSDNHSTDNSRHILNAVRDQRLTVISPPRHLTSLEHGEWLKDAIEKLDLDVDFSVFVGGHDLWHVDYLQCLYRVLSSDHGIAVAYSDTLEIGASGRVLKTYPNNLNTAHIMKPIRPLVVLMSLTHNNVFGGLWRERVRREVLNNFPKCAVIDHLLVAKASLYGDIRYVPGSWMALRQVEGAGSLDTYYKKHLNIDKFATLHGVEDFKRQLEFAIAIQKQAVADDPFYRQESIYRLLVSALVNAYIVRYYDHLNFFVGGSGEFLRSPHINKYLSHQIFSVQELENFFSI